MPSRRAVLTGIGGVAAAGVGGGVTWSRSVGTGQLYQKNAYVSDERNGSRYAFNVANVLYADSSQEVIGMVVEEFADAYTPPATLRFGPELHERLVERFDDVAYLLTFEADESIGGRVSRTDFNRVGLGDEVDVLAYDWVDVDANNHVVGVHDREPTISTREVVNRPLEEAYPE